MMEKILNNTNNTQLNTSSCRLNEVNEELENTKSRLNLINEKIEFGHYGPGENLDSLNT
jgi:hypothetical protein